METPYFLITVSREELAFGGHTFKAKSAWLQTDGELNSLLYYTDERGDIQSIGTGRVKALQLVINRGFEDMTQLDGIITDFKDPVKKREIVIEEVREKFYDDNN